MLLISSEIRMIIFEPTHKESLMYTPVFIESNCRLINLAGKASFRRNGKVYVYNDEQLEIGDFIVINNFSSADILEDDKVIKTIKAGQDIKYYLIMKLCDCGFKNEVK